MYEKDINYNKLEDYFRLISKSKNFSMMESDYSVTP